LKGRRLYDAAMTRRRRYALVGTGSRSNLYTTALATAYADRAALVGLCDTNLTRMAHSVARLGRLQEDGKDRQEPVCCEPGDFPALLKEQQVDEVIITSIDRAHHRYVIEAMQAGCDVICEKPLTVDAAKCQAVLEAERRTGQRLRVTFNYRYSPRNSVFAQLLRDGAIGRPTSVHFEWLLDTVHGADYFRRWHRDKRNSGGLMVHKASHHFDLVNWWLDAVPVLVFGLGDLRFYGRENAEQRGVTHFYDRGTGSGTDDPFALDLSTDPELNALYLEAEKDDGYLRDRSVFSDGISIEDDMAVMARYNTGATMSYHLVAYAPWEGYRVMVNGTEGRLELDIEERSYVSGSHSGGRGEGKTSLTLRRHWEKPQPIEVEGADAPGHGGGDRRLLEDLFGEAGDDPLGRAAGALDGAWAILTGAAANRSFATGLPVVPGELLHDASLLRGTVAGQSGA
jgi:predicted dehydrogenase